MEHLKYPIEKFEHGKKHTLSEVRKNIKILEKFPSILKAKVSKLSDNQLDTPYRPEGWTVRQVVHHYADSHANLFTRVFNALTEDAPNIKPYHEDLWAKLPDHQMPIKPSLLMVEGIHKRLVYLFKTLDKKQLKRTYVHPAYNKVYPLDEVIALYAWHCQHHLAHIDQALKK